MRGYFSRMAVIALYFSLALVLAGGWSNLAAQEKLTVGTGTKGVPMYDLPLIVAEEKGLWKEKGVNVEWLSFKGSSAMYRAMAAKSVDMSISMGASAIQAASRGVRVVIVADLGAQLDFEVWVKGDGPIKKPADLKGDKIGIGRRGGSSFALARFILNALKMEKDVQLVSVGAPQPSWPR